MPSVQYFWKSWKVPNKFHLYLSQVGTLNKHETFSSRLLSRLATLWVLPGCINRLTDDPLQALKQWAQRCKFALVKLPLCPWAIKKSQPGATICCQNVLMAIHHKDMINYRNSYICCELSFVSYFTCCFHPKYQRKSASLCPYFW